MFSNKGGDMFSQEGKVYSKEGDMPSESSHEGEVANKGENQRGNHGFRGRPSHYWMMVSIQASVNGFNWYQAVKFVNFCKYYACFDCVVINHQKGGDCNEHGTIYVISSDFGDRMTTQSIGLMV